VPLTSVCATAVARDSKLLEDWRITEQRYIDEWIEKRRVHGQFDFEHNPVN